MAKSNFEFSTSMKGQAPHLHVGREQSAICAGFGFWPHLRGGVKHRALAGASVFKPERCRCCNVQLRCPVAEGGRDALVA
jgi:hypothetical protein